jgi:hypothetical protein
VKTLQNVLQKHEKNRQKVISSLEKNIELEAKKLVEEYVEFSYVTILDNITKAQVAFSQNANNLLDIEKKELKQLDDFKTIKQTLIDELENLDDKVVVLDALAIEKQQYQFDLKNLESESTEKRDKILKEQQLIKIGWSKELSEFDEKVLKWEEERRANLAKEEEQRLYEHNLKLTQIKDSHQEKLAELKREQELKNRAIEQDIMLKRKALEANSKADDEAKEYLAKYEENLSAKVSKLVKIKLGFIKQEHESSMESEKNSFSNQLDILDLKIENTVKNSNEKRESIKELKEKLESAKTELNQLTQNTLSVKG